MSWGGGSGLSFGDASSWGPILAPYAVFAIGWITLCLVTAWVAGRKHRDTGLWFVLGFFSGPIALVAICLVKPAAKRD